MNQKNFYNVYFAGPLFSLQELSGNAFLADAIHQKSEGKFVCALPQTKEQRECKPVSIRDQDLKMVMKADLGLFHFDGTDLDDGTVVEFMFAKFLDIPAVVLRSDFRSGGDQGVEMRHGDDNERFPWNLMLSGYPRTKVILNNGIESFQKSMKEFPEDHIEAAKVAVRASREMIDGVALDVIQAFEHLLTLKPVLPSEVRDQVFSWAALFPGESFAKVLGEEELQMIVKEKREKGLL